METDATEPGPRLAADTILDPRRDVKRCPECAQRYGPDARFCPFDGAELDAQSWNPQEDSLLGTIVDDRYEVCAVLGEGGMGTVYKVRHVALERMFAMKVLRRDLATDAELAARFTQEAKSTASIKHPNVVQITDFGRLADGAPYFVMELLLGLPLAAAVKSLSPIPRGIACQIILKIAAGVGAAHDEGIVHRDLKPDNIFLVGPTSDTRVPDDVRVVDFGAAKVMGSSRVTRTGVVFGTPHFMSPEQASGEPLDHRADIYALGVIMYELFTGRVPFEADTYMGVLTQHMFAKPKPPGTVSPQAKGLGGLESIILRALEKRPEARFSSMRDLAAAIRHVTRFTTDGGVELLSDPASIAPPRAPLVTSPPRESEMPLPRRKAPIALLFAIAAGSVIAAATVWTWVLAQPAGRKVVAPSATAAPSIASTVTMPAAPPSSSPPLPVATALVVTSATSSAGTMASAPPPPKRSVRPPAPPAKAPDSEFADPWAKPKP